MKSPNVKSDLKVIHGSDEFISTDSDWDTHFPALVMKTHNTFTLTSGKLCDKKEVEASLKSGGDNCSKVHYVFLFSVKCYRKLLLHILF